MPEGKVSVPSTLSGHAAEIYRSAFLGAYEGTCAKPGGRRGGAKVNRDACAAKVAWGAVKEKYKKGKGEKWVARAGDPVVGPISDVPMQTSLPVYGTGMDVHEGETGTKLQRWRRAYIKALRDECRNADQPVECARRKANAAAGFVETDVKPIQRGGTGSGHHGHEGRPGEVGGSKPGEGGPPKGQEGFYETGEGYIGPKTPSTTGEESSKRAKAAGLKPGEAMPKANTLELGSEERNKWVRALATTNTLAQLRKKQDSTSAKIMEGTSEKRMDEIHAMQELLADAVGYQNFPELREQFQKKSVLEKSNGRAKYRSTAMDQFNDYPLSYVERREFNTAKRNEMAKAGTAMSDGSFPIATGEDVTIALRSLGRTSKPRNGVIAHIRKRAKAIGHEMSPALKKKAATIDRYMERMVLRSQANEVDKQHIHVLADNPIHRPDSVSSEVWRSLPLEQRTVRGEASYRIVERNYAQAVEDAEMNGWRVSRHYYSPDEYYFTKRFSRPGEDKGVMVRAIMVREVDSVDWQLLAMSEFASSSIARVLPSDIIQHKVNDRSKIPLLEG